MRAATQARILCRIEGFGPTTEDDVEAAANGGADEVLLPMVRGPREVEAVLEQVRGRMGVGILVETVDACGRSKISRACPARASTSA